MEAPHDDSEEARRGAHQQGHGRARGGARVRLLEGRRHIGGLRHDLDVPGLHVLAERFPQVPRIALTATADLRTRDEIVARLLVEQEPGQGEAPVTATLHVGSAVDPDAGDATLWGVSDSAQKFLNMGFLGALITTIVASIAISNP